jgi:chitinase
MGLSPLQKVLLIVLSMQAIMNYDVWGAWIAPSLGVGPNAPLNDTCVPTQLQQGSAVRAVEAWTDAKFPAEKLVIGVAAYGRSFRVTPSAAFGDSSSSPDAGDAESGNSQSPSSTTQQLASYPPFDASNPPNGDKWDGAAGVDQCYNSVPPGGIWTFGGLIDGGFLKEDGTPDVDNGIGYRFDECSQTVCNGCQYENEKLRLIGFFPAIRV